MKTTTGNIVATFLASIPQEFRCEEMAVIKQARTEMGAHATTMVHAVLSARVHG